MNTLHKKKQTISLKAFTHLLGQSQWKPLRSNQRQLNAHSSKIVSVFPGSPSQLWWFKCQDIFQFYLQSNYWRIDKVRPSLNGINELKASWSRPWQIYVIYFQCLTNTKDSGKDLELILITNVNPKKFSFPPLFAESNSNITVTG